MLSDVISKSYEELKREVEDRSWWKKGCHKPVIQCRKLKKTVHGLQTFSILTYHVYQPEKVTIFLQDFETFLET